MNFFSNTSVKTSVVQKTAIQKTVIRSLWVPVFIPGIIFQMGISALLLIIPWAADGVGLEKTHVLWILLGIQICLVIGSTPSGKLIDTLGEGRAMILASSLIGALAICVMIVYEIGSHALWSQIIFIMGILLIYLSSDIWSVARATYVANKVDRSFLGIAMSYYGMTQRFGRLLGPLFGGVLIAFTPFSSIFILMLLCGLIGTIMIVISDRKAIAQIETTGHPVSITEEQDQSPQAGRSLIFFAAVGMMIITLLRNNRDALIPVWLHQIHFSADAAELFNGYIVCIEILTFIIANRMLVILGRFGIAATVNVILGMGFMVFAYFEPHGFTLYFGGFLLGIGNGLGSGIVKTMGADLSPSERRAQFMGWWNSLSNLGILGGQIIATFVGMFSLITAIMCTGWIGIAGGIWCGVLKLRGYTTERENFGESAKVEEKLSS